MTHASLDALRAELRSLLALADTVELPKPDQINDRNHAMPGAEWRITGLRPRQTDQWIIRAVTDADTADCVYVSTPDSMDDDVLPLPVDEARRLGMALLAAANVADGVSLLDARRRP